MPAAARGLSATLDAAPTDIDIPISHVVQELSNVIGTKMTAYIGSVEEPEVIESWITGAAGPEKLVDERLRVALRVSKVVNDHYADREMVQAWLQGKNPDLNHQVVIVMIRTSNELVEIRTHIDCGCQSLFREVTAG